MDERLRRHPLGYWELVDPPGPEALRTYYAERYYQTSRSNYRPSYPPEERAWFDHKTARLAAAVEEGGGPRGGRLLDVGCGEGFAMAWFQARGWEVRGIDVSRAGMEAMNPGLLPLLGVGDLAELLEAEAASGQRYDLLWLTNVLEHVPDPPGLLARLRGLLAPGGACVVTVPNDGSPWQERLLESGQIPARFWVAIPDHLAYFGAASLRAVAEAAGWRCARLLADFPIDWFLGNPASNYVRDPSLGGGAHQARIAVETVLAGQPPDRVNALFEALAEVGMGRQITALLR